MNKNPERYASIERMLQSIGCSYSRVEAIDGSAMNESPDCAEILYPRQELIGTEMKSKSFNQTWIYDGTIAKSFPGLCFGGHPGGKGLVMSNMKVFKHALAFDYTWNCVLEDDAAIDAESYTKILDFIQKPENQMVDVVLLDARHNAWGGTAGVLYHRRCIPQLYNGLHPLSQFSITMEDTYGLGNLWDWKLFHYIVHNEQPRKINYERIPCIQSGMFESTISAKTTQNNV
jgi:Glycosyltransferase family 25 (LPS biosynthesis protein)